jgi:hypothetical protein
MARTLGTLALRAIRKSCVAPREAELTARLAFWVVLVSALARVVSLERVEQVLSFSVRSAVGPAATDPHLLAGTLDRLLALNVWVFTPTCWKRALVLHRFLARQGLDTCVRFGVKPGAGPAIAGHAWLEHDGEPLLEKDAGAYVVTFTLPPARALAPPAESTL